MFVEIFAQIAQISNYFIINLMAEFVDYLIIGGGIAGTAAAEAIRSRDIRARIAIISDEPHFLYSRVLLPKYILGQVGRDKVMLRNLSDYEKNKIDIYLNERAQRADTGSKKVFCASGKTFEFKKLLVASGGRPKPWPYEKEYGEHIFRLQTLDDAERLIAFLNKKKQGRALIVGGGFIALEFAKILWGRGFAVAILCKDKRFWHRFLDDSGHFLLKKVMEKSGINLIEEDEIADIGKRKTGLLVLTKKSGALEIDIICAGIGLKKNYDFLQNACSINESGIVVDEYLKTDCADVWAAGDIACYNDIVAGKRRSCVNWACAFAQGRTAGLNMAGENIVFKQVSGYSIGFLGSSISFIGDLDASEGTETIVRLGETENRYIRFFLKNNFLTGAALINEQENIGTLTRLIESKKDLSQFKIKMQNPNFALKELL